MRLEADVGGSGAMSYSLFSSGSSGALEGKRLMEFRLSSGFATAADQGK